MPLSDIITTAQSGDGSHHTVSVYFDISGEWASGLTGINNQSAALINWTPESINRNSEAAARRHAVDLDRDADFADWGTVLRQTETTSGLTTPSGPDATVRSQFVGYGVFANTNDTNQSRAINNAFPVFGFARALGTVGRTPTQSFSLLLGRVRDPAINFLGKSVRSLWTQYWAGLRVMLAFAYNDASAAVSRADATDAAI